MDILISRNLKKSNSGSKPKLDKKTKKPAQNTQAQNETEKTSLSFISVFVLVSITFWTALHTSMHHQCYTYNLFEAEANLLYGIHYLL